MYPHFLKRKSAAKLHFSIELCKYFLHFSIKILYQIQKVDTKKLNYLILQISTILTVLFCKLYVCRLIAYRNTGGVINVHNHLHDTIYRVVFVLGVFLRNGTRLRNEQRSIA